MRAYQRKRRVYITKRRSNGKRKVARRKRH